MIRLGTPSDPRQLVDEYFLRDLSEQEIAVLDEALSANAALRKRFVESMNDDLDLYESFERNHEEHTLRRKLVLQRAPGTAVVARPRQHRRQPGSSPVMKMAASVLLLLGAGLAYVVVKTPEPTPTVSVETHQVLASVTDLYALDGDPVSAVLSDQVRSLQPGDSLREGERISVPAGARLVVTYLADDTTITFDPESSFRLLKTDGANGLELARGCLVADVAKQNPGQSFRVVTDDAEIVVLGTRFEIRNEAVTRVSVVSGRVQVNRLAGGEPVSVSAGFFVESDQGEVTEPAAFYWQDLTPASSATLPEARARDAADRYITVDPGRILRGHLDFRIPSYDGRISAATLKLRVISHGTEFGGTGTVRVKKVDRRKGLIRSGEFQNAREIASYTGRAAIGMDLLLTLDPSLLTAGNNHLLLGMDEGGDDFWFAAQESAHPPELRLTIVK